MQGNNTINDGNFHHVVVVWDRSGNAYLYIDGVENDTLDISAGSSDNISGASIKLGQANGTYLNAVSIINSVSIWNTALSLSQVQELYNSGSPLVATSHSQSASLIGYWENEGSKGWLDKSTNSNNGTWSGSPSAFLSTESTTSGRNTLGFPLADETAIEHGVRFYGDGYIDADSIGTMKSICFWVKPDTNGENMINTDGGSHTITASSGTISAGGFGSPTIYVDGSASTTLTANTWQFIAVTTATGFSASDFKTYRDLNGMIDEIMVYSSELSSAEVTKNYNFAKGKHS